MHIPLWTTLPFAARHNGPVLEQRTSPLDICLPVQLQAAVPSCAYQCLQIFVANNYNALDCTSTAEIDFLCTNPTSSGLTIGEGSLQCVISNCLGADIQIQSGYTICDGVVGALPEMAGTITATISAITTILPSSETSITFIATTPDVTLTSGPSSSTSSTSAPETSSTDLTAPLTSLTSFFSTSFDGLSSTIETAAGSSILTSGSILTAEPSSSSLTGSPFASSSTTFAGSVATTLSASRSSIFSSSTSSATAAASTEDATKSTLGTPAVAGIVTAVGLVLALILGFLAYWFCVRRREKKRRSQRFSTVCKSSDRYSQPESASVTHNGHGGLFSIPATRFYSRETSQDKRASFWRRSALPPNDIGVATAPSTRVSSDRHIDAHVAHSNNISWSSPPLAMQIDRVGRSPNAGRGSPSELSDDDIEAQTYPQNQDLPALASPRNRRSSRSVSSVGVEKPAPLQLNKLKQLPIAPARGAIPLTPVYDNGTFEPTIRQVIEPDQPVSQIRLSRERQTPNFSRREPSLTRTSQENSRPDPSASRIMTTAAKPELTGPRPMGPHDRDARFQMRPPIQMTRFPVKPMILPRKESETTDRSISVHTEFEEDSTPEDEEDKQLRAPHQGPRIARVPLNNIQYPRVPRPAATKRQAENPHSPGALTIRRVDPNSDPSPLPSYAVRVEMASSNPNLSNLNISSASSLGSRSSESPVFPTPPPRNPARLTPLRSQQQLRSQITDAYRVASRPLIATSMSSTSMRPNSEFPPSAYPGAATRFEGQYDSPSAQRLGNARGRGRSRPLAQRMHAQGYIPRPPMQREAPVAIRNSRSTGRRPMGPRDGDLYFTLGEVRR